MEEKRFTLRMDGDLFTDIASLAERHRRSVAKEVECAIAEYVMKEKRRDLMSGYDPEKTSPEEAKAILGQVAEMFREYDRFL